MEAKVRLTQLSHKGGCGCKIPPAVLRSFLSSSPSPLPLSLYPQGLLVGHETSDDAAVYQINERQAIVATTDFFMPIVDDAFDFGRIAATNALSDVYAMGGTPLFALAIVGMPVANLPAEEIRRILAGGEEVCRKAGIAVAGGHTIDALEPIYGLAVIGVVDPQKLKRNAGGKAGDQVILSKPLGVGVYCQAVKKDTLAASDYADLLAVTTQLNAVGATLGGLAQVHALTDVTGFGLLGHLLEVCDGAQVAARVSWADVPVLPRAHALVEAGLVTGAAKNNWADYGRRVIRGDTLAAGIRALLTDPQTSGGLLVTCAPEAAEEVLAILRREGFARAAVIGELMSGEPGIEVV